MKQKVIMYRKKDWWMKAGTNTHLDCIFYVFMAGKQKLDFGDLGLSSLQG